MPAVRLTGRKLELERHIPALRRFAWALTCRSDDADDLVQDCLERALARGTDWRGEGERRAWLFAILHNLFVSHRRRIARRPMLPLEDAPEPSREPGQDHVVSAAQVLAAIDRLPEDQRAVLLLIGVEDLSYDAAARALGVPIGTVMSRLSRGRERLQRLLSGDAAAAAPALRGCHDPPRRKRTMTREEERRRPVGEDELQAFVDGRLSPVRRAVVDAWLAEHPDRAAVLHAQVRHRDALRAALRFKLDEPIPARLRLDRLVEVRRRATRRAFALAASVALAILVGAGGGWLGRGAFDSADTTARAEAAWRSRTELAASAHRVYTADAFRPVEINATAGDMVIRWLTNRLGQPVEAPDLRAVGLRFVGGRLIATQEGAAGQLMYDDDAGTRVTLFMVPARNVLVRATTAPRFTELAGIGTVSWADDRFAYTAVAAAPAPRLQAIVDAVRAALTPRPETVRG